MLEPLFTVILDGSVPNGFPCTILGVPFNVSASEFDDLSTNLLLWQVNKLVPETALNGVVLGVNVVVYNAIPFTTLKLDM
jgi:hypothetical protein